MQNIKHRVLFSASLYPCKNLTLIFQQALLRFSISIERQRGGRDWFFRNFIPASMTTLVFHVLGIYLVFNSWWLVPFWNNQWHAHHIWRETRLNRGETQWWNMSCNSTRTFYQLPSFSEDAISFLETTCLSYLLGPAAFRRSRRTAV